MGRRRFENLEIELSVALGQRVPRYALWLFLHDRDLDPENLGPEDVSGFLRDHLDDLLASLGAALQGRRRRRFERRCLRFDPRHPTPEEFMERLSRNVA